MSTAYIPWQFRDGWKDVEPIPQAETSNPLVPINYSQEYIDAMSTFRYLLSKHEISKRVVDLTAEIVKLNPAHYTVWAYRSKTLLALKETEDDGDQLLVKELSLLDELVKVHLKNYQVWQHRRIIVTALNDPSRELPFTTRALAFDSKNYHTWAYRQWALSHFFADSAETWAVELEFTRNLLTADVRNNSAWNHRWFTVFARSQPASQEAVEREISYTKEKLGLAPNNPSAWNYLRGVLELSSLPFSQHLSWAQALRSPADPDTPVALAVEFVADALAATEDAKAEDVRALYDSLATDLDPMRKGYWEWRKQQCQLV